MKGWVWAWIHILNYFFFHLLTICGKLLLIIRAEVRLGKREKIVSAAREDQFRRHEDEQCLISSKTTMMVSGCRAIKRGRSRGKKNSWLPGIPVLIGRVELIKSGRWRTGTNAHRQQAFLGERDGGILVLLLSHIQKTLPFLRKQSLLLALPHRSNSNVGAE